MTSSAVLEAELILAPPIVQGAMECLGKAVQEYVALLVSPPSVDVVNAHLVSVLHQLGGSDDDLEWLIAAHYLPTTARAKWGELHGHP